MSQPWFDEYFSGLRPRHRYLDDLSSHVAIGLASQEDIDRHGRAAGSSPRDDGRADLWLATEALWRAVKTGLGLTDDDLWAVMDELDRLDGVVDERHVQPVRACTACGAGVPRDRTSCQFCGAAASDPPLFP